MSIFKAVDVTKTYASHIALKAVSIEVPEGSIFGLLGPNGAGKTSLIRIINQITGPDSGELFFNGEPLSKEHVEQIGYLPEERGLYKKMKVGEQAVYLARLKGMGKQEAEMRLRKWFKHFDIDNWWDKKVEELSKGMAQKVQFITTILHKPKLIILDEPFSGFDPINANLVKDEIKKLAEEGSTIILSTHNMGSVEEICSHIALINNSRKVLDGPVKEIRNTYKENVYEISFTGDMLSFTNALWANFELLDSRQEENVTRAVVKLLRDNKVNDLLSAVIPVVEVHSVTEVIPSMNDIFIKVVNQKFEGDE